MDKSEFSLPSYRALIADFRARGYSFVGYEQVSPNEAHVVLRHDVDMDLGRAVVLAEEEAAAQVRASYFVLLRTEMYNVLSRQGLDLVRRLVELGHEVGLHFDASLYPQERASLEAAAEGECSILEGVLARNVETITFHRPAPMLQGLVGTFAGRRHGYEPRFFSEICYCSDSEGRWRFGHPLEQEAVIARRAIQLVTHPIWWCATSDEDVIGKLNRLIDDRKQNLQLELGRNCRPFAAYLDQRKQQP